MTKHDMHFADFCEEKARKGDGQFAIAYAIFISIDKLAVSVREHLRSDHPLQGETFDGIASALGEIAEALDQSKE